MSNASDARRAGMAAWMLLAGTTALPAAASAQDDSATTQEAADEVPTEGELREGSGDELQARPGANEQRAKLQHQERERRLDRRDQTPQEQAIKSRGPR